MTYVMRGEAVGFREEEKRVAKILGLGSCVGSLGALIGVVVWLLHR